MFSLLSNSHQYDDSGADDSGSESYASPSASQVSSSAPSTAPVSPVGSSQYETSGEWVSVDKQSRERKKAIKAKQRVQARRQFSARKCAIKRLHRDLLELHEQPLPGASAHPLDADAFTWHVNLAAPEAIYGKDVVFHLVLTFPEDYPSNPPSVDLLTAVPHQNVFPGKYGKTNHICLDILEDGDFDGLVRDGAGWSSAFTTASLLVTLQAFLLDERMAKGRQLGQATAAARKFVCDSCPHDAAAGVYWPPIDSAALPAPAAPVQQLPVFKMARHLRERMQQRKEKEQVVSVSPQTTPSVSHQTPSSATTPTQPQLLAVEPDDSGSWEVVVDKKKQRRRARFTVTPHAKPSLLPPPVAAPAPPVSPPADKLSEEDQEALAAYRSSKTYKRNQRRARKREQRRRAKLLAEQKRRREELKAAPTPTATLAPATTTTVATATTTTPSTSSSPLTKLPYKVLLTEVFSFLEPEDIASAACVNKEMRAAAEAGYLWRILFQRRYPASKLTTGSMQDWRRAYQLEAGCVVQSLVCYHNRTPFTETVLGMPAMLTVNPVRKTADYIYCFAGEGLLSFEAFEYQRVRTTPMREAFTHWLPLFISGEHFDRALPLIERSLLSLSPGCGDRFEPRMVLDVMCKAINCFFVLLNDNGIHASRQACTGFASLHRLFIALVHEYNLQPEVDARIAEFISHERHRVKSACPSLGNFLPLLLVSDTYSWRDVAPALLRESFDRRVLWVCREYPELASTRTGRVGIPAAERLDKTLAAAKISLRMYSLYALVLSRTSTTDEIALSLDAMLGSLSAVEMGQFRRRVASVFEASTWPQFFKLMGMRCPASPEALNNMLVQAVRGSLRKGYHKRGMDFTRVQRSGVSKILLRGETYSAPPTLQRIVFADAWTWDPTQHGVYFDASVLAFNQEGELVDYVDFGHVHCLDHAVRHSGDVLDGEKHSGSHEVNIDLTAPSMVEVHALFFTLTSWNHKLVDIQQPFVEFRDPDSGVHLCRYELTRKIAEDKTGVIMCCLRRKRSNPRQWEVRAMGTLGHGRAGSRQGYETMRQTCVKFLSQT